MGIFNLVLTVIVMSSALAVGQPYPGRDPVWPRPPSAPPSVPPAMPPSAPPSVGSAAREDIFVNQYLYDTRVDLSRYLSRQARGQILNKIIIQTRGPINGEVSLLGNNWEEDRAIGGGGGWPGNGGGRGGRGGGRGGGRLPMLVDTELMPRRQLIIGRDMIELQLRGSMQVERVTVFYSFSRGGGAYPPPPHNGNRFALPVYVNQMYYTRDIVSVDRLLNLQAYRGYMIESLQILSSDYDRGVSRIDVFVNSRNMGHVILDGRSNMMVYLNERIDGYDRIELQIAGRVKLDQVILNMVR